MQQSADVSAGCLVIRVANGVHVLAKNLSGIKTGLGDFGLVKSDLQKMPEMAGENENMTAPTTCRSVVCTFAQEDDEQEYGMQELKITVTHQGSGAYLVLETERWAVDHPDELMSVVTRVWKRCHKLIDKNGL